MVTATGLPYARASAISLCSICAAEVLLLPGRLEAPDWALLVCLCLVVGAAHGLAFTLGFSGLARLPRAAQHVVWWAIALGAGLVLARDLGVFANLRGPYRQAALQALAGCIGLSVALAVVAPWLQPTRALPKGAIFGVRRWAPRALGALLVVIAAAAFYVDHRYYVGLYPRAHDALRWTTWLAAMFACALLLSESAGSDRQKRATAAVIAAASVLAPVLATREPLAVQVLGLRPWPASIVRSVQLLVDLDRDGYAAFLGAGDCDEWNPRVNPGAPEIPGNGIDDNCMLGDARRPPARRRPPGAATEPSPFDVVLITVDSWRPDHLGLYNPAYGPKGRGTSPVFDEWARGAVVFDRAFAPGGWTSIAVASLMRGLYPRRLQWTRYFETTRIRLVRPREFLRLRPDERSKQMFPLAWNDPNPTLPELLHARGMRTVAVVHDGFSTMLTRGVGVEAHFDAFREVETFLRSRMDDAGVVELARREIARTPREQRLFLWAHFFGPHSPNQVHPGVRAYGPTLIDGYDHELRYFDAQLPALLAAIAARGVPTIIAITGDHGEVFAGHVRMHGFTISEQDIRVPLAIKVPGWPAHRTRQLVSTLDLFPTLLSLTKTPAPAGLDGLDLAPFARPGAPLLARRLISESWRYEADGTPIIDYVAAFDGTTKLVADMVTQSYRRYDQSVADEVPEIVDRRLDSPLADLLRGYLEETGGPLRPRP